MNKTAVAQSFSAAAEQYDSVAHLQRKVADRLMTLTYKLPLAATHKTVDLGTGTGYLLPMLAARFKPKQLFGLDLSMAMLRQAKRRTPTVKTVQADLEQPPFLDNSVHLAVSSLAVQWLDCPKLFLANAYSMLAPGGYLAVATVGPKTLYELKTSWATVDSIAHVNNFNSAQQWHDALECTNFNIELWQEETIEVQYGHPLTLLNELKVLGANHVDRDSQPAVSSVRKMLRAYQQFKTPNERFPASWEVYYLIVKKPT